MSTQQELFEKRYVQISQTDRIGWSEKEVCESAIEMYRKLLTSVGVQPGRLLELGCGRGNIALEFANEGWDVTGVDFSPTAIAWAKDFAASKGQAAEFIVRDLCEPWGFGPETFDVILDANCLHFFHGENRNHFLSQARSTLKAQGVLVICSLVNQPKPADWALTGYDPNGRISIQNGVTMNNYVDAPELIQEVISAGFRVIASVLTQSDVDLMWLLLKKR